MPCVLSSPITAVSVGHTVYRCLCRHTVYRCLGRHTVAARRAVRALR